MVRAYDFGPWRLDLAAHKLLKGGQPIALTPKAFDVLVTLIRHRHRVISKEELLAAVWPSSYVTEDSLTQNIWALRRALGDDSAQPLYIATVPKTGYRFVADVVETEAEQGSVSSESDSIGSEREPGSEHPPSNVRWTRWHTVSAVAVAGAMILAAAAAALMTPLTRSDVEPVRGIVPVVFTQEPPAGTVLLPGVAIAPDGHALAFVAQSVVSRKSLLWLREIASGEVRSIPGTEGAEQPFWSPKSNALGFFADGQLKTVDVIGTGLQTIVNVGVLPQGGSWSHTDTILFAAWRSGLFSVPAAGGQVTAVTHLNSAAGERSHRNPQFLPDGRHYLFSVTSAHDDTAGTYLASLDSTARTRIVDSSISAVQFVAPDRVLGLRGTTLVEARLDVARARLTGSPTKISGSNIPLRFQARAGFAASPAGLLSFGGGFNSERLMLFTRHGKLERTLDVQSTANPALSPDGNQVAVTGRDSQAGIWIVDLARGASTRLTQDGAWPMWSPDGRTLVFTSNRSEDTGDLYVRPVSGLGDERLLLHTAELKVVSDWSRDGNYIVFTSTNPRRKLDLWFLPMTGDRKPVAYLQTGFSQIQAQVSPDGRWLAYASDESGRWEVYLQSFPVPGTKRVVSVGGGGEPKWSPDGRELFYVRADKNVMVVDIPSGHPADGIGQPRALFTAPVVGDTTSYRSRYTVSPGGDKFLFNALDESSQTPITVIVNWTALSTN
jgi:eukaryotic-like serine/threonine-protein kinase